MSGFGDDSPAHRAAQACRCRCRENTTKPLATTTDANFDYSGPLTEAVLLGSVASRFPRQTLDWDGAALKFTSVAAANEFVKRPCRKGREVAGL